MKRRSASPGAFRDRRPAQAKGMGSSPRFEAGRVQGRKGLLGRVGRLTFGLCLVLLLMGVTGWLFLYLYHHFLHSPYLRLRHLEVYGLEAPLKQEIVRVCGLDQNTGILAVNLKALRRRIEAHPWIRSARVQRRLPDTIIVEAEKERPVAMAAWKGRLVYVNDREEIFKTVEPQDPVNFPVITGLGENPQEIRRQLQRASALIYALEKEKGPWSLKTLSEIHVAKEGYGSVYFMGHPFEVRLSWNHLGKALQGLKRVLAHLERTGRIEHVVRIDLNYADGAVVRFKKA